MSTRLVVVPNKPARSDWAVAGVSIIEVVMALTLLVLVVFGLAQLFMYAARAAQQGLYADDG